MTDPISSTPDPIAMLLFWTLNPEEYNITTYEINVTENRTLTSPEQILNYTVGTVLILCFLTSTVLNPLLLFHHSSTRKQGITTLLFVSLAFSDFLTNLITHVVYTVYLLLPQVESQSKPVLGIFCNLSCSTGCFSVCVTTLLAITRFLKITNPFVRTKKRILMKFLLTYTCFMFVANALISLANTKLLFEDYLNIVITVCTFANFSMCTLGVIFSIMTVLYVQYFLKPSSPTDHVTKKVCGTILLMNIVYVITLLLSVIPFLSLMKVVQGIDLLALNFKFLCFFVMPLLTSAWNPIVIIAKSKQIQESLRQLISRLATKEHGQQFNDQLGRSLSRTTQVSDVEMRVRSGRERDHFKWNRRSE